MTSDWPPKNGKRALITGITGQDGSYLAELLLSKGYASCRPGARDVDVARSVGGETTRVCRREHLLAILVQTGRDKDRARLPLLLEGTKPDERLLGEILDRHDLRGRWNEWTMGRHAG